MIDLLIIIYRMIKKNSSQKRFNTAAARIMASSKLPSDFFLLSRDKDDRESSLWSHRNNDAEKPQPTDTALRKDPLLFTFHRSSSEDKLKIRKFKCPTQLPKLSIGGGEKKSQTKLPPVSLILCKQNISSQWFKDFEGNTEKLKKLARISNKILRESNFVREQIIEVLR